MMECFSIILSETQNNAVPDHYLECDARECYSCYRIPIKGRITWDCLARTDEPPCFAKGETDAGS